DFPSDDELDDELADDTTEGDTIEGDEADDAELEPMQAIGPPADDLEGELARWGIELPEDQIIKLDAYREVLWTINEQVNLTRHATLEKFVTRDVCDSLALAYLLDEKEKILDVGTGGGVPGAIVAIVRPDIRVTLCDSVGKKAKAVQE